MKRFFTLLILAVSVTSLVAQRTKTDANIVGHVVSGTEHLPYVTVSLKGTTIGTLTDETGHYQLVNVPVGKHTIVVSSVGYKRAEAEVLTEQGKTIERKFDLETDDTQMDEVVVSADRSEQKRTEAPVIVTTISPKLFAVSQAVTLSEGLNYCPGLRTENNCQNCGFNQVRMNGMEGPYSQILINSRPIFSGLAGVYGLELIPSNMIERVEVVRGGGSALYGSNAIAGTINLILKDPVTNSYELGLNSGFTGVGMNGNRDVSPDYSATFNASLVSDDRKTGLAVYGFTRDRKPFDANGDGYSELSQLSNTTIGSRFFHRLGNRGKLSLDFFNIKEKRSGGNRFDYPLHQRDIAEAVEHDMKTAALTFERFCREYDMFSAFVSGQYLHRDSYYGANRSLKDYGQTTDFTYNTGLQYKLNLRISSLVAGIENTGGFLTDKKLGFPDYANAVIVDNTIVSVPDSPNTLVSDQASITSGIFAQYELKLERFKFVAGARGDHYRIIDYQKHAGEKTGNVLSPRVSVMYNIMANLQTRLSFSRGYRAPQIFDEDLHIETSGSRKVVNVNNPNLKQETSNSFMASVDYNTKLGATTVSLLCEGFYTVLNDAFKNEIGSPDSLGVVRYTRVNATSGAVVRGINTELRLKPTKAFSFNAGFTLQQSFYEEAEKRFGEKRFFRTPNQYGFLAVDYDVVRNLCISTSGSYTGSMLVPYFGTQNPDGELRTSGRFFDWGVKLAYTHKINGASIQWTAGVKNILNSYQTDHDSGINRDPSYMYGPGAPRTVYAGIKIGNLLD